MHDELISVIEAGRQLERRKSTVFKVMKRLGIHARKRRTSESSNQVAAYLTMDDFRRVQAALETSAAVERDGVENGEGDSFISAEVGVFYLIQLEPTFDPTRFKVGFASNLNDRLRTLRCSAPFASVLASWPCRRLWEKTAIDCVTFGCEQVHTEVFRAASLDHVKERCGGFFQLMPPAE